MHARYCSPYLGRFANVDPALNSAFRMNPQSWNRYSYVENNPVKYIDSDGEILETAWDIANIGIGVVSLVDNVRKGNVGAALLDTGGIIVDSAAAIAPFVPGGAGTAIKAGRAVDKAADVVKATSNTRRASNAADAVQLARSLALREGASKFAKGGGIILAGGDSKVVLKQAERLASQYGGRPSDWVKVAAKEVHTLPSGTRVQARAFRNEKTGQLVELRLKNEKPIRDIGAQ